MKKRVCVLLPFAFVGLVLCLWEYLLHPRVYVTIQDDSVYYDMSESALIATKGTPTERCSDTEVAPFRSCDFQETICGFPAYSGYTFYCSTFGTKLTQVGMTISCDTPQAAQGVFDTIYNRMDGYFQTQAYYYNRGIEKTETSECRVAFGTDNGAIGVSNEIVWKETAVCIHTHNLY